MRKRPMIALCAAAAVLPGAAAAGSAKDVFADVSGGVVVVIALDAEGARATQGSGVVVGGNEVATNCHVVSGAKAIAVRQAADARGRETYRMAARLAARDEKRDLCLLFVEELSDPPAAVPVRLSAARAVSVGEEVYAVGAPRGLELSLSRGVVSQLRGDYGKRSAPIIQTDAAVSPGSSGGGLFNAKGELIGITSFKFRGAASEGFSFAAPVEWVGELVAAGRERAACFSSPTAECLFAEAIRAAKRIDAGRIDDAFWSSGALDRIVEVQAQAGDIAGALRTAGLIDGTFSRNRALGSIVEAQAQAGDIAGALRTAGRNDDASWRAGALRRIAKAQAQAEDIAGALRTAGRIDEAYSRAGALGDIAEAQTQAGARVTFADAVQAAGRVDDTFWRGLALRGVAEAQARAGDIAGALRTAGRIDDVSRGFALGGIAEAQAQAGDIVGALRMAGRIDDASSRDGALDSIAEAQARAGDIAGALRTAGRIDDVSRGFALGGIAEAQAQAGDIAGALRTVGRIDDALRGLALGGFADGLRGLALGGIAKAQAQAGDIAGALRTAGRIDGAYLRDGALDSIAKAQAQAGDIVGALRTAGRIDDASYRAVAHAFIAVEIGSTE